MSLLNILERSRSSIKPGFERMRSAMFELGLSQETLPPALLIAGTNGKGTTSGILWRLLSLSGLRCGLYTSPHLVSFHERIQVSHQSIDMNFLEEALEDLRLRLSDVTYESLTFFELTTLLAFFVFQKTGCEVIVLEVGLGGRWDATNIIDPIASAVVSIDYDHQEWLGDSLSEIAREKLGVARSQTPLFWGDLVHQKELEKTLEEARRDAGFLLFRVGEHFGLDPNGREGFVRLSSHMKNYPLPKFVEERADVLKSNFALAFALYSWCMQERKFSSARFDQDVINFFDDRKGSWPYSFLGRMEKMRVSRGAEETWDFYLDVSHNVASIRECVRTLYSAGVLHEGRKKVPGFVSILRDKDLGSMLELLREIFEPFVLFKVDHERSITEERLRECDPNLLLYDSFESLWGDFATRISSPIVVCGSFYAVGSVLEYFGASTKDISSEHMFKGYDTRLPSPLI